MNAKQKLIKTIRNLLAADDVNVDFLEKLDESELRTLAASIRDRLDREAVD